MKPVDFAYELRRLTEGFNAPALTEQRGTALFEEYGGHPAEVVRRAVSILLTGDRYPIASQMRAAFEAARLWDHEQRRKRWTAGRGKSRPVDQILEGLAGSAGGTSHPLVPQVCVEALRMLGAGSPPTLVAAFYRKMAEHEPLAFMDLGREAEVLESWGDTWPNPPILFPVATGWKPAVPGGCDFSPPPATSGSPW